MKKQLSHHLMGFSLRRRSRISGNGYTSYVKKKNNVFPTFPGFYLKYYSGKLQYESCFCSLSKKILL